MKRNHSSLVLAFELARLFDTSVEAIFKVEHGD
jgi:DNA-binding XRE family transcriptional regulator